MTQNRLFHSFECDAQEPTSLRGTYGLRYNIVRERVVVPCADWPSFSETAIKNIIILFASCARTISGGESKVFRFQNRSNVRRNDNFQFILVALRNNFQLHRRTNPYPKFRVLLSNRRNAYFQYAHAFMSFFFPPRRLLSFVEDKIKGSKK